MRTIMAMGNHNLRRVARGRRRGFCCCCPHPRRGCHHDGGSGDSILSRLPCAITTRVRKIIPILCLAILLLLIIAVCLLRRNGVDDDVDISEFQSSAHWANDTTTPRIIAWTSFFGAKLMRDALMGKQNYNQSACPYKCYYTDNRNRYSPSTPMVIIYHSWDFSSHQLPPPPSPSTPPFYQLNVFLSHESPHLSGYDYQYVPPDFFNATMTYRRDSHFYLPYDELEPLEVEGSSPASEEGWSENEVRAAIERKKDLALIFVSHCNTPSKREYYLAELKKHINMSDFGWCNWHPCRGEQCVEKELESHFFYLAFENSVCRDYLTEKFWRAIHRLTVPVVLSRASIANLPSSELPPQSYIAADDFPSAKHLAEHLRRVAADRWGEYALHLEWTKHYKKKRTKKVGVYESTREGENDVNNRKSKSSVLCQLCQWAVERRRSTLPNITAYWVDGGECQPNFALTHLLQ